MYVENEVVALYHGKNTGILLHVVNLLYPRFTIEIQRFNLSFFLSHAQQVIWRTELLLGVLIAIMMINNTVNIKNRFKSALNNFWQIKQDKLSDQICHFCIYGGILFYMHDFIKGYEFWLQYHDLYQPILLFKILHIPLWPLFVVKILFLIFILACLGSAFRFYLKLNSLLVCLLFILFQGWNYSFGKINHGFAPLTYITIIWAASHWLPNKPKTIAVQLIKVTIVSCYLMAGLEKLFISHFTWISASTFSAYLLQHPTSTGLYIAHNQLVCTILPSIALLIQLFFVLVLIDIKLKYYILLSGAFFHWGTVLLFGISSYFHPWVLTYVFFIDWEKIIYSKNNLNHTFLQLFSQSKA